MSFMDELRKLTQPYDDEDDFYEGADSPSREQENPTSPAQKEFESAFAAEEPAKPEPPPKPRASRAPGEGGGLFSGFVRKNTAAPIGKPRRERTVNFNGNDQQVILFNPKSFDEAGELVNYLSAGKSVVMTLEGVQKDNARRLLDFLSGVTFALDGKITPISAKTYFVTPMNVNVLGAGAAVEQPDSDETYL